VKFETFEENKYPTSNTC